MHISKQWTVCCNHLIPKTTSHVMLLFTIEWSLLLQTTQQRLPMLLSEPYNSKNSQWFLGSPKSALQMASWSVQLIFAYTMATLPILLNVQATPKNCPFPWGSEPHLIHGFLGPPDSVPPNGISIGSAVFAGFTNVTNRQTHRQTDQSHYSVCNNSPHLMQYMRCGLETDVSGSHY